MDSFYTRALKWTDGVEYKSHKDAIDIYFFSNFPVASFAKHYQIKKILGHLSLILKQQSGFFN